MCRAHGKRLSPFNLQGLLNLHGELQTPIPQGFPMLLAIERFPHETRGACSSPGPTCFALWGYSFGRSFCSSAAIAVHSFLPLSFSLSSSNLSACGGWNGSGCHQENQRAVCKYSMKGLANLRAPWRSRRVSLLHGRGKRSTAK